MDVKQNATIQVESINDRQFMRELESIKPAVICLLNFRRLPASYTLVSITAEFTDRFMTLISDAALNSVSEAMSSGSPSSPLTSITMFDQRQN